MTPDKIYESINITEPELKAIVDPIFLRMEQRWADVQTMPELSRFVNTPNQELTKERALAIATEYRKVQYVAVMEAFIAGYKAARK